MTTQSITGEIKEATGMSIGMAAVMIVLGFLALGPGIGAFIIFLGARDIYISSRYVTPADLAATTFRHLGIDLDAHWINPQGRPIPIVTDGGRPIPELC